MKESLYEVPKSKQIRVIIDSDCVYHSVDANFILTIYMRN